MARYRDRCEHTFVEIPTPAERLRALKESCAPSDIDRERQLEATSLYLFSLSSGTVTLNSLNLNDSLANALGQTIFLSHASLPKNNRTAMPPMNYYFFLTKTSTNPPAPGTAPSSESNAPRTEELRRSQMPPFFCQNKRRRWIASSIRSTNEVFSSKDCGNA